MKREFAPTLELALKLHPDTKQVVVVAGTSEFDTRLLDWARQQFKAYEARLPFTYLTTLPLQKLLTELAGLPPQTFVLFTTLFRDALASLTSHTMLYHLFQRQRARRSMASSINILAVAS